MTVHRFLATPSLPSTADAAFDTGDTERIRRAVELAKYYHRLRPRDILTSGRQDQAANIHILDSNCRFAHIGLLLFPATVASGIAHLTAAGLSPSRLSRASWSAGA